MNREETIFEQALGTDSPADREAYLRQACAGDEPMFERLQALLRVHDRAGKFLDPRPPAAEGASNPPLPPFMNTVPAPIADKAGDRIGRYKLLEKIGEGGCGVVYMAEQQEPVRRRVALKVIKLGMDIEAVIARFEAERQALAMMDHPNIAKVFDAGATDAPVSAAEGRARHSVRAELRSSQGGAQGTDAPYLSPGRPYFVMELVRGTKITEFCDRNNLTTQQRLGLFIQVCQAVQHAHQKGIIHRDLKPSNILVTVNDGAPVPKVIDFGIAKATTGERLTDKTVFTAFQQFLGTPAYMSPEQAEMTSLDIDTRSDIYSLGVLLYELLTGQTPFDAKELLLAGLDEMRRTIREQEPQRPSTKLSTMVAGELTTTAARRQTEPPKLVHAIRGDLDWIVMKALEKDRARRYDTANGLARDLQRHLDNEPVTARPPSNLYRLQKMVRRNKLAFAAFGAIAASLLIGFGVSTWMFLQEREAKRDQARLRLEAQAKEQRAQIEAAKSQQVTRFLKSMLEGVTPSVAMGRDTAIVREILDKAAVRVGKELTNQPEVQIELLNVIGSTYTEIEAPDAAEPMLQEALRMARRLPGNENLLVAKSLFGLSWALVHQGRPGQEAMLREALAIQRKLLGEEHEDVAGTLSRLGGALAGQTEKAAEGEAMERKALAIRRKLFGETNLTVSTSLHNLGVVLSNEGKLAEAETAYRQSLSILESIYGHTHPEVATTLSNLGSVLTDQGIDEEESGSAQGAASAKIEQGIECQREALKMIWQFRGVNDGTSVGTLGNLIGLLRWQGKLAEMDQMFEEALNLAADRQKQNDAVYSFRASFRLRDGRFADAAADLGKAVKAHPKYCERSYQLAAVLADGGDVPGYRKHCEAMLARWGASTNASDLERTANACLLLPPTEAQLGAATRAAGLSASLGGMGFGEAYRFSFAKGLAEYRQGRFAKALELAGAVVAETNSPGAVEFLPPEASARVEACAVAAMAHQRLGHEAEAREWLARAIAARTEFPAPNSGWFSWSYQDWLVPHILLREARELIEGRPVSNEHEDFAASLREYAAANARRGNLAAAEVFLLSALSLYRTGPECDGPGLADTLGRLSTVLASQGKKAEADRLAREAVEALNWYRKTGEYAGARAQNELAWLLATTALPELRDGTGAIALAEKAVAATSRKAPEFLDTLSAAYAESRQFEKGVAIQKEAIALNKNADLGKQLEAHLKLYESNSPYRQP